MPTNKPKVQIVLDQEIYDTLKQLAKADKRSVSQLGGLIIEKYINEYKAKEKREQERTELKGKLSDSLIG